MSDTSKKHHAGQKPITIWVADELAERIDAHLQQQVAGIVGARPSRQAWIIAAMETALAGPAAAPEPAPAPPHPIVALVERYLALLGHGQEYRQGYLASMVNGLSKLVAAMEAGTEVDAGNGQMWPVGKVVRRMLEIVPLPPGTEPIPPLKPKSPRKKK